MKFIKSLSNYDLAKYLSCQINNMFPDKNSVDRVRMKKYIDGIEDRVFHCFSHARKKYFFDGKNILFNHLNSDQYAMFIYMLSNFIYKIDKNENYATKLYALNKALHALEVYYTVELPDIFLFVHPYGSGIGRAKFGDYLVLFQNCSIGANDKATFPIFKGKNILYSHSKVIGRCVIGENVFFGADSFLLDRNVDDNKVVLGRSPDNKIVASNKDFFNRPPFKF